MMKSFQSLRQLLSLVRYDGQQQQQSSFMALFVLRSTSGNGGGGIRFGPCLRH